MLLGIDCEYSRAVWEGRVGLFGGDKHMLASAARMCR
jgi:hypothetical protein